MATANVLTVKELADEFKIAQSTVYALVASGSIPHIRFGAAIRFRRETIEAWLATHEFNSGDLPGNGVRHE